MCLPAKVKLAQAGVFIRHYQSRIKLASWPCSARPADALAEVDPTARRSTSCWMATSTLLCAVAILLALSPIARGLSWPLCNTYGSGAHFCSYNELEGRRWQPEILMILLKVCAALDAQDCCRVGVRLASSGRWLPLHQPDLLLRGKLGPQCIARTSLTLLIYGKKRSSSTKICNLECTLHSPSAF